MPDIPIDLRLILGSLLFGGGWAIAGICPGTVMPTFFTYTHVVFWLCGYIIGALVLKLLDLGIHKPKYEEIQPIILNA